METTKTRYPQHRISSPITNLENGMEQAFEKLIPQAWRGLDLQQQQTNFEHWAPLTDLYETDKEYQFSVELPGVSKSDIRINVQENQFKISDYRKPHRDMDSDSCKTNVRDLPKKICSCIIYRNR